MSDRKLIIRSWLYPFRCGDKWYSGKLTKYYSDGTEESSELKPSPLYCGKTLSNG